MSIEQILDDPPTFTAEQWQAIAADGRGEVNLA